MNAEFFEDMYKDDEDEEPSFSLYEFKKWLSKQKKEDKKQEMKEEFKDRFKKKIKNKPKEN